MKAASTSWSAIQARRRARRPAPAASKCPLVNVFDADAVRAVGRAHLDLIARAVTHQRLAQRRLVADASRLGVGLRRTDDAVRLLVLAVLAKVDGAAHRDHARRARLVDEDVVLDDLLELLDASFLESLLVLGGVVLEVL